MLRIVVAGGAGKMGREVCVAADKDPDIQLVGAIGRQSVGLDLGKILHLRGELVVTDNLERSLLENHAQVMVDFSSPSSVMENVRTALQNKVHVVVGTTGINDKDLQEIGDLTKSQGANAVIAPNFAIGAVLMIKLAEITAAHFSQVEIIEEHHDKKVDAPSGTALKTADTIARKLKTDVRPPMGETIQGVRGGSVGGIHIHSVRLAGLSAHQEVIFGGSGQTLRIRHDVLDRSCYMPGVIKSIKAVPYRKGLTVGLDKLLDL